MTLNPYASGRRRAALAVLEAMATDHFRQFAYEELGWLPPEPHLFDTLPAGVGPVGRYLDPLRVAVRNGIQPPGTEVWPGQEEAIAEHVHGALTGDATPGEAAGALREEFRRIETEY